MELFVVNIYTMDVRGTTDDSSKDCVFDTLLLASTCSVEYLYLFP